MGDDAIDLSGWPERVAGQRLPHVFGPGLPRGGVPLRDLASPGEGMTGDLAAELQTFASMSREGADAWIATRQAENAARRKAECEANGRHVLAMDERACPHCDTPYSEVLDG